MKVIVGLGNPGLKYENTRHNVGFEVVDGLLKRVSKSEGGMGFEMNKKFGAEVCRSGEMLLVKPQTYMNESGRAVRAVVDYYRIRGEDLWVVHDDLDMKLGSYKVQLGKGPKVHGGIGSVERMMGSGEFWRVRVGVDARVIRGGEEVTGGLGWWSKLGIGGKKMSRIAGDKYVLMKIDAEEREVLDGVVKNVVEELVQRMEADK